MGQFSQVIFDRWFCIHQANKEHDIEKTHVINFPKNLFIPDNHEHFSLMGWSSEWNHYLMSYIIKNYTKIPCISVQPPSEINRDFFRDNFKEQRPSSLRRIFTIFTRISNFLSRDGYAFFLNTYLPTWKELFLQMYMLQLPRLFTTLSFKHSECNPSLREWEINLDNLDNLDGTLLLNPWSLLRAGFHGHSKSKICPKYKQWGQKKPECSVFRQLKQLPNIKQTKQLQVLRQSKNDWHKT